MRFENKTALVTGAAVGIGRAVALRLAEEGAKIVILDMNYDALMSVKGEAESLGAEVLAYKCDVGNESEVGEIVARATEHFGGIDILVNNAALWRTWKSFTEIPTEEWKSFIDVNIMGVVYMTKAVLPKMLENGYGRIINVASVAGVYGNANMACYSTTKGALIAMTKALAKEVTDRGVLVNAVSPGSVSPSSNPDLNYFEKSELSFMGRTGTDTENANLICFLAGDESSYISGQNIQIDGCRKKQ